MNLFNKSSFGTKKINKMAYKYRCSATTLRNRRCLKKKCTESEFCTIHNLDYCRQIPLILDCSICQDEAINPLKLVKCGHTFCKECIYKWLPRKDNCPYCRTKVDVSELRDSYGYCVKIGTYMKFKLATFNLSQFGEDISIQIREHLAHALIIGSTYSTLDYNFLRSELASHDKLIYHFMRLKPISFSYCYISTENVKRLNLDTIDKCFYRFVDNPNNNNINNTNSTNNNNINSTNSTNSTN